MIQTLGLFRELSGLFWRIITLAGVLSKSIKNMHKAFSPQFIFLNRCQICPLIAISRSLNLETKALHILRLLQKERGSKKSLLFAYLFFKVKAAWYQQYLNMGLGVENTITIRKETGLNNKVHVFLLLRTVGLQSHL